MKRAEVVTIPAEKGVPKVEIRETSGKKSAKTVKKSTTKSAQDKAREKKFAEILESASAGASSSGKTTKKVVRTVPIGDDWPEDSTNDAGVMKKSAAAGTNRGKSAKKSALDEKSASSGKAKRAKARKPNEKITPASIFRKMLSFGKAYQIENEQDFIEAARIYAEEAYLISQMRDQIAEEGLTVVKSYKTGDVPVAHPLLSELPRHVESANKCLTTIGNMISDRGAKKERAARDLDAFRLHR